MSDHAALIGGLDSLLNFLPHVHLINDVVPGSLLEQAINQLQCFFFYSAHVPSSSVPSRPFQNLSQKPAPTDRGLGLVRSRFQTRALCWVVPRGWRIPPKGRSPNSTKFPVAKQFRRHFVEEDIRDFLALTREDRWVERRASSVGLGRTAKSRRPWKTGLRYADRCRGCKIVAALAVEPLGEHCWS